MQLICVVQVGSAQLQVFGCQLLDPGTSAQTVRPCLHACCCAFRATSTVRRKAVDILNLKAILKLGPYSLVLVRLRVGFVVNKPDRHQLSHGPSPPLLHPSHTLNCLFAYLQTE
jgi:hypothetical protein